MVVAELIVCPICGRDKYMKRAKRLYGHEVCRKCWAGFINRRQLAYIVDNFILSFIGLVFFFGIMFALSTVLFLFTGPAPIQQAGVGPQSNSGIPFAGPAESLLTFLFYGAVFWVFLLRDVSAGAGRSFGKLLCGLRTMNVETGKPIGVVASLKRNLPILIPFMPLVLAVQLNKGHRWGDGWSKSAVIWTKYADSIIFRSLFRSPPPDISRQDEMLAQAAAKDRPLEQNPYRPPTP